MSTRLRARQPGSHGSIPSQEQDIFLSFKTSRPPMVSTQPYLGFTSWKLRSQSVKLNTYTHLIKNEWNYTSTSPLYFLGMHKEALTLPVVSVT